MPTPYATSRIWGRLLNVRKCVEADYFKIPHEQIAFYEDLFKLPAELKFPGLREMLNADLDQVRDLLNGFLILNSNVHQFWSRDEIEHTFMNPIMHSYVVEEAGRITDFFSFYILPTLVLKEGLHKYLNQAYSYLNASPTMRLEQGIKAMLILAKGFGADNFKV
jgi:glycylpeptide N-tetradecanoyltransferase